MRIGGGLCHPQIAPGVVAPPPEPFVAGQPPIAVKGGWGFDFSPFFFFFFEKEETERE
jgi:hypothetical protein